MKLKTIFISGLFSLMIIQPLFAQDSGVSDGGGDDMPKGTFWECFGGDAEEESIQVYTSPDGDFTEPDLGFSYGNGFVPAGFAESFDCHANDGLTVGPRLFEEKGVLFMHYKMTGPFTYRKNGDKIFEKNSSVFLKIALPPTETRLNFRTGAHYSAEVSFENLVTGEWQKRKLKCELIHFQDDDN